MSCYQPDDRDLPRAVRGRHLAAVCPATPSNGQPAVDCPGCQPCDRAHCRVCDREHAAGTCAECLTDIRGDLATITRLCGFPLLEQALAADLDHESVTFLAPAADPEARNNLEASALAGRIDPADVPCSICSEPYPCDKHIDSETHPLFVLGTWDAVWRRQLVHAERRKPVTVPRAAAYLGLNLHRMANYEHTDLGSFARDLRRTRAHLEAVLRDGEQVDRGAPCFRCHIPLEREWGKLAKDDGWRCPRCKEFSTDSQYRFAVMQAYRETADRLTASEIEREHSVPPGTLRRWANGWRNEQGEQPPIVRKRGRDASGRQLYDVADVLSAREGET